MNRQSRIVLTMSSQYFQPIGVIHEPLRWKLVQCHGHHLWLMSQNTMHLLRMHTKTPLHAIQPVLFPNQFYYPPPSISSVQLHFYTMPTHSSSKIEWIRKRKAHRLTDDWPFFKYKCENIWIFVNKSNNTYLCNSCTQSLTSRKLL